MTETKTRTKLYKSGKSWVAATSGIAIATFGVQAMQHSNQVSADDVPNTSKVTSSANIPVDHSTINNSVNAATNAGVKVTQDATTNANVNTKDSASAKQAAQQNEASQASDIDKATAQQNANTQAFKDTTNQVNQTNSDAQNKLSNANNQVNTAANNATSNGVNVTTNSQNVTPDYNEVDNTNDKTLRNSVQSNVDKTNDAVATATQNAQNQTNNINQVTDKYVADKKQLADEKAQVDTQKAKYNDLINQAKADGINVNDQGVVDNQNFQDTMNQYAQKQSNLQAKIDKFNADKAQLANEKSQVAQQQGSYQDIINQAKAAGITINDHGTVDNQNFQDTMNQYAQKQQSLQQAITDYNNAKAQLATEQNNIANSTAARNAALQKAQSAGVTVEQSKAVSTDDYNAAKSDLDNQTNAINQAVDNYVAEKAKVDQENADNQAKYQKDLDAYDQQIQALQQKTTEDGNATEVITQSLLLGHERNVHMHIDGGSGSQVVNSDGSAIPSNSLDFDGNGTDARYAGNVRLNVNGTATVTYTGLKNSTYNGKAITTLVRAFKLTSLSGASQVNISPAGDPVSGFDEAPVGDTSDTAPTWTVQQDDQLYYADGTPVVFGSDAYVSAGSLNTGYDDGSGDSYHSERVQSNGQFIQVTGSSIVPQSDGWYYGFNSRYNKDGSVFQTPSGIPNTLSSGFGWDNTSSLYQWYGAAVFKIPSGQSHIILTSDIVNQPGTWYKFAWFTSGTNLPVQTAPAQPKKPDLIQYPTYAKATQHDVNYTRTVSVSADVQSINYDRTVSTSADVQNINYNRTVQQPTVQATNYTINDEPASVKPADLTTDYHLNQVTAIPYAPVKSVDVDDFDAAGKSVTKGDTLHFTLKSSDMAADRGDDITSSIRSDQLDDSLTFAGYKAYWTAPDGTTTDVTNLIKLQQDGQHLTFTDTNTLLDKYNADKSKQTQYATIVLDAIANTDGASASNVFSHSINGSTDTSNTTAKTTTIDFHPIKETVDSLGYDSNGKVIEQGDALHYIVKMDLTQFNNNTLISKNQLAKGLSLVDSYSPNFNPEKSATYVMVNGQNVTNQFTFNWDDTNHRVTAQVNDPATFLKNYSGTTPELHLLGQASQNADGVIANTAYQNDFDDSHQTDTVQNTVVKLQPQKALVDIVGSKTQYSDIAMNSDFVYALTSSTRPANIGQTTSSWSITDNFDTNHDLYQGSTPVLATQSFVDEAGNIIKVGTDISQYFNVTYDGHKLTVSAKPEYLALMNNAQNRSTAQGWVAYANMRRIAAGDAVNTLNEFYNNRVTDSNTVTSKTSNAFTPHKETVDANGVNNNGSTVERGDMLHYELTWDNSDITKDTLVSKDTGLMNVSLTDTYSKLFMPAEDNVQIMDANGNNITGDFSIVWGDQTMKIMPWSMAEYLQKYAGQKLTVHLYGQVIQDADGELDNTASQTQFGVTRNTETVKVNVAVVNPKKSLTDQANGTTTFDKVALNSEFVYNLSSSDRPANLGQITKSWSISDKFDTTHDSYQGATPVYATHDFVDSTGKTVTAGTDISHYFTTSYNAGTLLITATQDYLNVMNSDINRKSAQGWAAYPMMKRIATGTAVNTLAEAYNNRSTSSNTVSSTTVDGFTPHKEVLDDSGKDSNGRVIEQGDNLHYQITWDNSDIAQDTLISQDLKTKGLSITDNFSALFVPNQNQLTVMNGSTNVTDDFNIAWGTNTVTVTPKDINSYIQKYAGTKLTINLLGQASQDANGDVQNTAVQNEFGENRQTETVINKVDVVKPSKELTDSSNGTVTFDKVAVNAEFNYKLDSSTRPANSGQITKQWSITDNFDTAHDAYQNNAVVYATHDFTDANGQVIKAGTDISQYFAISYNNGLFTATAKQAYLDAINSDANRQAEMGWTVSPLMKRIATGTVNNVLTETYNNRSTSSNTVTSTTTDGFAPHKTTLDDQGRPNDGATIEVGDNLHYQITWDNSDIAKDTLISSGLKTKGLSITDNYSASFVPSQNQLTVMNGTSDVTSDFNINWGTNTVTISPKDINSYIQKYAGTKLTINLLGQASQNANGDVTNTATQNEFGENRNTETVVNKVQTVTPSKELTDKANGTATFDKVALNSEFTYKLDSGDRPANIGQATKNWSITDNFDTAHDAYQNMAPVFATHDFVDGNGQIVKAGTDISQYFDVAYSNGQLTVTAKQSYLDIINSDANRKMVQGWSASPLMKRIASGTANNVLTETYNNRSTKSNTVTSTTSDGFTPHKETLNSDGQSDDGKTVEEGDALHYQITWDNSDLSKGMLISDDLRAKGLSITDNYSSKFTPSKDQLSVVTADGRNVTSEFEIDWLDSSVTIKPRDLNDFISKYAGTKLLVNLLGVANQDADGDITNTATQNQFGQTRQTETVTNTVHKGLDPVKGIVIDGNNQNPNDLTLNSQFSYSLSTHIRPANLGEKTKQWSISDKFDTEHDAYTGVTTVKATRDFVGPDGQVVKAGSDITSYFDITYVDGQLTVTAKQSYLDIMNSDANMKTEQGWEALPVMKRIAVGDVYNTMTEKYNNRVIQSNTVKSHTNELPKPAETPVATPEKATQPAPAVATPAKATPVVETPAPTPHTGKEAQSSNVFAIMLTSLLASIGLLGMKKKQH